MEDQRGTVHVPADTGRAFWGPGDRYTFLVTGAESGGHSFVLECVVAPGGGPPPHIHQREEEAFYLLDGSLTLTVGDRTVEVATGDFVHIPRGTVHSFRNIGDHAAKMLAIFSPAGMEGWFEAACPQCEDRSAIPPAATPEMIERMLAAGPGFGVEWVVPSQPAR